MRETTIDRLDRGANALAPPGLLAASQEGPFWRKLVNLCPRDGGLARREGTVATADQLTFDDDRDRALMLWAELPVEPDAGSRYLAVTSREVFIGEQSVGWVDVTPIYQTGTVNITNGTAALAGIGTAWSTQAIAPGQLVELPKTSGDWYQVQSVNSNVSITLTTNFTGTTIVGGLYQIRRNFLNVTVPFFYAVLNGDVYLAGGVSTGYLLGFGTISADGGVLKIPNAATALYSAFDPSATTILLSGERAVDGADTVGYNIASVHGLEILPDGRLVMPVRWIDASIPTGGGNRILFSDNLDLSLWTTGSGGFEDISDISGEITGMSRLARDFVIHMGNAGIEYAELTNELDTPLALYRTDSVVGSLGPRTCCSANGSAYFVGQDLNLRVYTGQASQPVLTFPRFDLQDQVAADDIDIVQVGKGILAHYPSRDELRFYFEPDATAETTRELRVSLEDGSYSIHEYGRRISTVGMLLRDDGDLNVSRNRKRPEHVGILGSWRKVAAANAAMIYRLDETVTTDALVTQAARIPQAETDDMSFGNLAGLHVLPDVLLSYISASSGTIECVVIRDGAVSETLTVVVASTAGYEKQVLIQPNEALSARVTRLRFQGAAGSSVFVPRLTKLQLWSEDIGDVRAVV